MAGMRWKLAASALGGALVSCGGPQALDVRPYHLRELPLEVNEDEPMLRGERLRRMHGAIGIREQEQRLGQYYTVLWHDDAVGAPVRVVMRYRQASSGSRVLWKEQEFAGEQQEGKAEFRVVGDDYIDGGRVLAWRVSLLRGEHEVASRQSYLWE